LVGKQDGIDLTGAVHVQSIKARLTCVHSGPRL
jgi:hypothetical protein